MGIKSLGVSVQPDFQLQGRWPYPIIEIGGLGEPGFLGANWAGKDRAEEAAERYRRAECYRPPTQESIFDRIVFLTVSWPTNPVLYAGGGLVGATSNITLPYSIQLRS